MNENKITQSLASQIWNTLSVIDVNQHVEQKGKLSYLSWTWAWATLMQYYPEAEYTVHEERYIGREPNQTCEVSCYVTIRSGDEEVTRSMWLPVMDHTMKAKIMPDSRAISDARMRCLVKCLAMFGLGHYIYAGSDLPADPPLSWYMDEYEGTIQVIQAGCSDLSVMSEAAEEWFNLPKNVKEKLWTAKTAGGPFDMSMKKVIQSTEFRESYYGPQVGTGKGVE